MNKKIIIGSRGSKLSLAYANKVKDLILGLDLVNEKEKVMSSLVEFLDIELDQILFSPTKGNGKIKWLGNAASGEKKNRVDTFEKNKYRRILSLNEITKIEFSLRKEMNYLNYSLDEKYEKTNSYPLLMMKNYLRKRRDSITHSRLSKKIKYN